MNQNNLREHPLNSGYSLLAKFQKSEREAEDNQEAVFEQRRIGAKVASSIKALAPIQSIVAFEQIHGLSAEDSATLCRTISTKVHKEACKVCHAIDIPAESFDWGQSYFASAITNQIAEMWPQHRHDTLKVDWSIALAGLASPTLEKGLAPNWKNTPFEISMVATALNATQKVMNAYDNTFNLCHCDRNAMIETFSDWLITESEHARKAIEQTLKLSNSASASLMQVLMKNSGNVLASCYHAYAGKAAVIYTRKASDTQKQQLRKTGFPLDDLRQTFRKEMQSLVAVSVKTITTLSHNNKNENRQSNTHTTSFDL
jgi:hypothetical protein